jgi:hypothetical protein
MLLITDMDFLIPATPELFFMLCKLKAVMLYHQAQTDKCAVLTGNCVEMGYNCARGALIFT